MHRFLIGDKYSAAIEYITKIGFGSSCLIRRRNKSSFVNKILPLKQLTTLISSSQRKRTPYSSLFLAMFSKFSRLMKVLLFLHRLRCDIPRHRTLSRVIIKFDLRTKGRELRRCILNRWFPFQLESIIVLQRQLLRNARNCGGEDGCERLTARDASIRFQV